MIVKDLDNNEYKINLRNFGQNRIERSKLHIQARELLKEIFFPFLIYEEVPIKVLPKKTLFLDFWIEKYNRLYEIAGIQHYEFNTLFHNNKLDLFNQKRNDRLKQQWAEYNGFKLVELKYDRTKYWREDIAG